VFAVEALRPGDVTPPDGYREAGDEQQPERVGDELVGEIEVTGPEGLSLAEGDGEHAVPLVDEEDGRGDQKREKAPENERVHEAADQIPVELFLVGADDLGGGGDPAGEVVETVEPVVGAAGVAGESTVRAVGEDDDGDGREEIKEGLLVRGNEPEGLAGDRLGLQWNHGGHTN
jgi:hypothetical protein